jgi:hypothetical protein
MAAENGQESGKLSRGVCNNIPVHPSCFEKKAEVEERCKYFVEKPSPVILNKDKNYVTVTWKKMEGNGLYSIFISDGGPMTKMAVTRGNFYNFEVRSLATNKI